MIRRVVIVLAVAVVLIMVLWLGQRQDGPLKVSGFIEADEIRVGSRVGGRVASVHVREGQPVTQGMLLVELEPFDLTARLKEAEATHRRAQAKWKRLRAGFRPEEVAQARARVDQLEANLARLVQGPREQEIVSAAAELQLAEAERDLALRRQQRAEELLGKQAISQEQYDEATTELRTARARLQVKKETLALLRAGTRMELIDEAKAKLDEARAGWQLKRAGYRAEDVAEAAAELNVAEATVEAVQSQLEELRIRAPVDGMVEAVALQPGDLVARNAPALSIMDTSHLWVRAYVPEDELDVRVGDTFPVTVDSFPRSLFPGRVTFVARQAEFTPGNVQTPEDRSQQVFRIKVDLLKGLDRLRPGMAADVWLEGAPIDG